MKLQGAWLALFSSLDRYTGPHVRIKEIGKERVQLQAARQQEYEGGEVFEFPKRLQEVIKSLLPSEPEELTLEVEWKSFPLLVGNTLSG